MWREVQALLELEERSGDFLAEPIFSLYGGPAEDPNLGRRVGPFRLLERLPGGGMGAVYLAERVEGAFAQRAAVKLIKRGMDTEEIIRRFEMERQILAQLGHDGIAKLLDGGTTEDGLPFFALEYVEGAPLDQYCRAQGLLLRERITLFLKVCEAVAFAHRNLVVHR
ncbi:MAG TPA: serine/threonine protein kinase, partial [Solibacterales bacterium]|nr:serine/threonine protein kinase [Bryobacterales bacterium]